MKRFNLDPFAGGFKIPTFKKPNYKK